MTENKTLNEILQAHDITAEEVAEALYTWAVEYSDGNELKELTQDLVKFLKLEKNW